VRDERRQDSGFLLPILNKLIDQRADDAGAVLTPTRELAAQITGISNIWRCTTPITAAAVFGGVGMGPQNTHSAAALDVIIGTPGRLLDHFRRRTAKLSGLRHLVLTKRIACSTWDSSPTSAASSAIFATRRQTFFFSATDSAADRARVAARDAALAVTINLERRLHRPSASRQALYPVAQHLKPALLTALLPTRRGSRCARVHADQARADRLRSISRSTGSKSNGFTEPVAEPANEAARGFSRAAGKKTGSCRHDIAPGGLTSLRSGTSSTSTSPAPRRITFTASGARRMRS